MSAIDDLRQTVARLRGPGGCPWDQEQTHASLVRCLIDEVSELIETIDQQDFPHMREELGDVLLQVVFHARLAEEAGHFALEDVAREINEKLIRRHPHVFGADKLETSHQVLEQWDAIKAREKPAGAAAPPFKALPPRLPALMFAEALAKQVGRQGRWDETAEAAAVAARADNLDAGTLGRELFVLAAAAQRRGLDSEGALRQHAGRLQAALTAAARPA